jgi:hypothetical protein
MVKISRFVYLVSAWLFVVGVLVQVFLAGMVVVAFQIGWNDHRTLGSVLGLLLVVMIILQYLGGLPKSLKRMTWALFGVYLLQVILISLRGLVPVISAFHPVLALVDFVMGLALGRSAWQLVHEEQKKVQTLAFN